MSICGSDEYNSYTDVDGCPTLARIDAYQIRNEKRQLLGKRESPREKNVCAGTKRYFDVGCRPHGVMATPIVIGNVFSSPLHC